MVKGPQRGVDVPGMSFFAIRLELIESGRGNVPVGDNLLTATLWFSPGKAELVLKEMLAFYFYSVGARGIIK